MPRWCLMLILLGEGLLPLWARAQSFIRPSERVSTYLNVREDSSTSSPVVGALKPGEHAALLQSVPYWYQVRLNDGVTTGYVSKAWSSVVEIADSGRLRLGAWNVKKLGHGSSKNIAAVAQVIDASFDVAAIVEVMQKQSGHPGYDRLMEELGDRWEGQVTSAPRPEDPGNGNAEFYSIVYRHGVVRPCEGWPSLRYFPDNHGGGTDTVQDIFVREPAFGCFEAGFQSDGIGVDFLLAGYHARWSGGDAEAIREEVDQIDQVMDYMGTQRPGERDIVVAGDFNLPSDAIAEVVSARDRTDGVGSTLNRFGERTSNLYDHVLLQNEAASSEFIGNARVLDVRDVAPSHPAFYSTVSDHLPVVIEVQTSGPDDDGPR